MPAATVPAATRPARGLSTLAAVGVVSVPIRRTTLFSTRAAWRTTPYGAASGTILAQTVRLSRLPACRFRRRAPTTTGHSRGMRSGTTHTGTAPRRASRSLTSGTSAFRTSALRTSALRSSALRSSALRTSAASLALRRTPVGASCHRHPPIRFKTQNANNRPPTFQGDVGRPRAPSVQLSAACDNANNPARPAMPAQAGLGAIRSINALRAVAYATALSGRCPATSYSPTRSPTQYHRR